VQPRSPNPHLAPTRRLEPSAPPLPTAFRKTPPPLPAKPPPLPTQPFWWTLRSRLALFIAVGLVSTVAGAILFPGGSATRNTAPGAVHNSNADNDPALRAASSSQIDPVNPRETPIIDGTGANVKPAGLNRKYQGPSVPPIRRPGPAGDLAAVIDQHLDGAMASANVPPSPLADDAEFLRRAYLDLTGHIPAHAATVAFLDSQDPYKRANLIDELLASPEFGKHFAQIWADTLIKRDFDNNKNLKPEAFAAWLADEFNKGTGWNKIVSELITADGNETEAPQVFFYAANQDNNQPAPDKLVDSVGNLFMGVQIQCAQCHVHPFVSTWGQQDFWGMAAFFGHTKFEGAGKGKRGGPVTVKEVEPQPQQPAPVVKGKPIPPKPMPMPFGAVIAIPDPNDAKKTTGTARAKFFEGEQAPLGNKGPYRPTLAAWLTSPQNKYFARAGVNRLWAHFFARGIVNPLEDMNDKNKPSHPELLRLLSAEFAKSGFDVKFLLRAIANTNAYQRTSRPVESNRDDDKLFSHMPVKVLGARELLNSLTMATAHQEKVDPIKGKGGMIQGGNPLVRFFDTRDLADDPTEFTNGIPQMLRLMNSGLTNSSTEAASRIVKSSGANPDKIIEDLYLTALSRRPHPAEVKRMTEFVAQNGDKGYAGVFWALLNSAEFTSNR
jgi:Protein of unknown function (DUF1549)/Protein of unknown function (DUF1553)